MQHVESSTPSRTKVKYSPHEVRLSLRYCLVAWIFGAGFFAMVTGPALVSFLKQYLKVNDSVYGIMASIGGLGVLFQLLGSYLVERSGRTKKMFLIFVTLHRLLWLGVAAIPLFFPVRPGEAPTGQVVLACTIMILSAVLANFGSAGWAAWMADIVPKSLAGTFFGMRARFGLISMIIASNGVAWLLDLFPNREWMYAVIFAVAAVLGALDILLFYRVPEVPRHSDKSPPTFAEILTIPWRNHFFRRFILFTAVTWIAYGLMASFVFPYCIDSRANRGLGMNLSSATLLLVTIPMIMMAWVNPFWGRAIDRFGPKNVLAVGTLGHILVPLPWVIMQPELLWLVPVMTILGALVWPGVEQANLYVQLKIFPEERRTAYIAMFMVLFGLSMMVGTMLGGYLATFWEQQMARMTFFPVWMSHYQPVFLMSILLRLAAFALVLPALPIDGSAKKRRIMQTVAQEMATSIPVVPALRRRLRR